VNWLGGEAFLPSSGTRANVRCSWATPGTVSGGTDVIRMDVRINGASACTCDLDVLCDASPGAPGKCYCDATFTSGQRISLQLSTATNCLTNLNPSQIVCNVSIY